MKFSKNFWTIALILLAWNLKTDDMSRFGDG